VLETRKVGASLVPGCHLSDLLLAGASSMLLDAYLLAAGPEAWHGDQHRVGVSLSAARRPCSECFNGQLPPVCCWQGQALLLSSFKLSLTTLPTDPAFPGPQSDWERPVPSPSSYQATPAPGSCLLALPEGCPLGFHPCELCWGEVVHACVIRIVHKVVNGVVSRVP
jgi:hypothetical protein